MTGSGVTPGSVQESRDLMWVDGVVSRVQYTQAAETDVLR